MNILTQKIEGNAKPQVVGARGVIVSAANSSELSVDLAPRQSTHPITFCRFKSSKDIQPMQVMLTWGEFVEEFSSHPEGRDKDGSSWSPVSYKSGCTRKKGNVEAVYMAVLDVDDGTPNEELLERFSGFNYLAHSSFSHRPEHNKYRVIVPLTEPVPASEWSSVWKRLNQFAGGKNDASVKDASRLYFMPRHPIGTDYHFVKEGKGRYLSLANLPELVMPEDPKSESLCHSSSSNYATNLPGLEDDWGNNDELRSKQGLMEVVDRCALMKFASDPDNQPHLPEPLWQAMISNACRFDNSDDWIHQSSKHHPEYDESATDRKIEHALNGSAPITCQRIRELGFQNCPKGGCGRPNGLITKAPAGLAGWMSHKQLAADRATPDQLPDKYSVDNFAVDPTGVYQIKEGKDGNHYRVKISSRIDVLAQTRDENNSNWGIELHFKDPDGIAKSWALPKELLSSAGESYRASLLRMGADIGVSKEAKEGLAEYLNAAKPAARALSVRQPGWFNDVFVLPGAIYGKTNQRVVYETKDPEDLLRFAQKGTFQSWQDQVAALCQGNSRAVLSVCIGLAPPLLKLLDEANGGFHIRGNSSCGKTLCLAAGSSVWGGDGLIRTWNMTVNGLEGVAAMHNDVLLPLDELGQADGKAAGEAAYMHGNGKGKSRANRDGDPRAVRQFRNLMLSSGEKSLSDVMASAGQSAMAGQEVRMIEIAADAGCGYGAFENIHGARTSQEFAERFKRAISENHGHAGRAFVEYLSNPELQPELIEQIRASIQKFTDTFVPEGAVGQVSRVGRRFGLVAAAGELCIELGILPWPEGEAINACKKCFDTWIELRGGVGNHEATQYVATVRRFIELHGESRFSPWNENAEGTLPYDNPGKTINRVGFRRATEDGRTEYFILPEAYNTEICAGLNATAVTKELMKRNLLCLGGEGKPQVDKRLPGIGKKKVYHLKPDILGELSPSEEK
jgi:uncharacterized protein (DUF927 family)